MWKKIIVDDYQFFYLFDEHHVRHIIHHAINFFSFPRTIGVHSINFFMLIFFLPQPPRTRTIFKTPDSKYNAKLLMHAPACNHYRCKPRNHFCISNKATVRSSYGSPNIGFYKIFSHIKVRAKKFFWDMNSVLQKLCESNSLPSVCSYPINFDIVCSGLIFTTQQQSLPKKYIHHQNLLTHHPNNKF